LLIVGLKIFGSFGLLEQTVFVNVTLSSARPGICAYQRGREYEFDRSAVKIPLCQAFPHDVHPNALIRF